MKQKIINYISAGYPALFVRTHEENRANALIRDVALYKGFDLFSWTADNTMRDVFALKDEKITVDNAINRFLSHTKSAILMLPDFHIVFEGGKNPMLIRLFKNVFNSQGEHSKSIVFTGCNSVIPQELERLVTVVDLPIPDRNDITLVVNNICETNDITLPDDTAMQSIASACLGMTIEEIENALANSIIQTHGFDVKIILHEKGVTLKNNGLVDVVETNLKLEDIGGLDNLISFLRRREITNEIDADGLPPAKGILLCGLPGTGKSLTAKITGNIFGVTQLHADIGRIFGSHVGESEQKMRRLIQIAESMAPCVLWIDEIEKGFSGSQSSGKTDGGTSARVFGTFLDWMQNKTKAVFVVGTANSIKDIPAPFWRKGRFDEMFFVDLPNPEERQAIWRIQLRKYREDPDQFEIDDLSAMTEGFTGAEIEQLVIEGKYEARYNKIKLSMEHFEMSRTKTNPLSIIMKTEIDEMRDWCMPRMRLATEQKSKPSNANGRKLVLS